MSIVNEWPMVKLGEVLSLPSRWSRKDTKEYSYIDISSLDSSLKKVTDTQPISSKSAPSRATTHVIKDDVLVSTVRPSLNAVAMVPAVMADGIASSGIAVLRAVPDKINPCYLFHVTQSQFFIQRCCDLATGASYPAVSDAKIRSISIPLPPLLEQQRIAEILDTVATTISSSREQLVALSQIQENLLTETDQVKYVPLGDLAQIRSGTVKPNEHPYCDLPHVAPDNIESGTGRLQNINTASEDGVTSNKYAFCAGDLLYSKIRPYLNKFAIPQFDGVCSADMYALVPQEPATAEYLAMTLQSPLFLAYAEQQSGRASIPKINRKSLTAFPVPFHSEAEIQRVTEIYQETETARSAVERKLDTLQELQNSLSTRAFAGQL